MSKSPFLLCIVDGFGVATDTVGNAVTRANTPNLDKFYATCPHSTLRTDGHFVGLPDGQMGNSEVGHMSIGSGRVIPQPLERIANDLESDVFDSLNGYQSFLAGSKDSRAIHVIGLLSDGGVHSHADHALGLCKKLNKLGKPIFIHAISDGRDVGQKSGQVYVSAFEKSIESLENVSLVSVIGRFYAMDRDNRWNRIEKSWALYNEGVGQAFDSIHDVFQEAYDQGVFDEFIPPSKLNVDSDARILDGDSVFLFNFRADRMRELAGCFLQTNDSGLVAPKLDSIVSMTSYDEKFDDKMFVAYPEDNLKNTLGDIISSKGMTQLRIAETEKYPHVTYYLSGGREAPFDGEDRILIPSPKEVKSYDEMPDMALPELTSKLVDAIEAGIYDFIALNIANGDMVGHCGEIDAAVKAVEFIDTALGALSDSITKMNGQMLIIADHGNVEEMIVNGDQPSTQHSTNPVPCIYIGGEDVSLVDGKLSDVAPTVLTLMKQSIPDDMTGDVLIR